MAAKNKKEPLETRLIKAMKSAGFATTEEMEVRLIEKMKSAGFATTEEMEVRLIEKMKSAGFATKKDVEEIVHDQLTEHHHNMVKPDLKHLSQKVKSVESTVKQNSVKLEKLDDQLDGLKAEFSEIPPKKFPVN